MLRVKSASPTPELMSPDDVDYLVRRKGMWALALQLGSQESGQRESSTEDLTGHAGHGQVSVSHCLYRRT